MGFDLLSFWQWSFSDVVNNVTRGVPAAYLVAQAPGVAGDRVREEWATYDLKALDGTRVEVKSAPYIQSWRQDQLSRITFRVPKTRAWDKDTNQQKRRSPATSGRVRLCVARAYPIREPCPDLLCAGHMESYNRAVETLCRDCGSRPPPDVKTCPACGSPHIARHKELHGLTLAHLDCDAFYATIEKRGRPELRDVPVIVGGHHRGVVAACCYVARAQGVHSAMPMFKALKACPDATVIKPDMTKYAAVGREVRAMMENLTPLVEPLSIDEAFMDLAGTEALHRASPAVTLAALARRVKEELSITVSIGLSYNKFLAKIASDLDKPRGGFATIQSPAGFQGLRRCEMVLQC